MKLITWNCNMAFRNKAKHILRYNSDIVVVPECEHHDKIDLTSFSNKPTDVLWYGSNKNKGLGIFAFNNFKLKPLAHHNPEYKMIVPIAVHTKGLNFTLYAIWANNPGDPDGVYVEQTWKALNHYDNYLSEKKTFLIGDFNSNTIWDRKRRKGNHSDVVQRLESKGITSVYHKFHKQEQGKEMHPTQYMYRHVDKPYHLDYCFASKYFTNRLEHVEVGEHDYWSQYSDHVPLIATFS